jgi:nicotinate-nucleotide--dimethylbenzimidazole phosphoribosyltransferase
MSRGQAERAIVTGIELALDSEFDLLGTGDMGIANTTPTTASAATCSTSGPSSASTS